MHKGQNKHHPTIHDPERTLLYNLIFHIHSYVDIFPCQ